MKKQKGVLFETLYLNTYKIVYSFFRAENDEKSAMDKSGRFWIEALGAGRVSSVKSLEAKIDQMKKSKGEIYSYDGYADSVKGDFDQGFQQGFAQEFDNLAPDLVILQLARHADDECAAKAKRKKNNIALIILTIAIIIGGLYVLSSTDEVGISKVELGNEDQISFVQRGVLGIFSTQNFDERYVVTDSAEFVQEEALNIGHVEKQDSMLGFREVYQTKVGKDDVDHIYSWETGYYKDDSAEIIALDFNSGLRYAVENRGYVEVSFCETKPLRAILDDYRHSKKMYILSEINGNSLLVTEYAGDEKDRGTYSAEFIDFSEDCETVYVVAHNVEREYFIEVLKLLSGEDVELPSVGENELDLNDNLKTELEEVAEQIAMMNYAEKRIYDGCKGFILEDEAYLNVYSIVEQEVAVHDGKEFNVTATLNYDDHEPIVWYMQVEYVDGAITEIGTPKIEFN